MNNKQGANAEKLFSGKATTKPAIEAYAHSAKLFADTIKKSLPPGSYTIADFGSHSGNFMDQILKHLEGYTLRITAIDMDESALERNPAEHKIVGDLSSLRQVETDAFDISITRYSLVWNNWSTQKKILDELVRITTRFSIIQNLGAGSEDPLPLRDATRKLFDGTIPPLTRKDFYWSSTKEIEDYLENKGVEFKKIQEKRIDNISEGYGEKYNLSEMEKIRVNKILAGANHAVQSTWLLKLEG